MQQPLLIAGGGIGGLAAALAASRAGMEAAVYERAAAFSEVGAGIQLGPNSTRALHNWGLRESLAGIASFPEYLQVRDIASGRELGTLPLGSHALHKYGAPYACLHRSDLHALLLGAVGEAGSVELHLGHGVDGYADSGQDVLLRLAIPADASSHSTRPGDRLLEVRGCALVGADGLWSRVRKQLLGSKQAKASGHLALRALVPQAALPARLRSQHITVWLGPRLHLVQYPVRGGEWMNVVAVVQGSIKGNPQHWDHANDGDHLALLARHGCAELQDLVAAVSGHTLQNLQPWRMWPIYDRPPVQGPRQQAKGCVALLGDAAHPMRPYLAQGAGMALEDAAELGSLLARHAGPEIDLPDVLQHYALNRWRRNARVQARARLNGRIFHASGLLRQARDASMRLLGARVLDLPWLYGHQAFTASPERLAVQKTAKADSSASPTDSLWNR